MLSDPIADMLARIRNAALARKQEVLVPYSKLKEQLGKILVQEGYLKNLKTQISNVKNKKIKNLTCELEYKDGKPAITKIRRISKPSLRVYVKKDKIPKVLSGMGISIISTSKGLMTGKQTKKKSLGGELICEVW